MATVEPYKLYTDTEIQKLPPPRWLIEGILQEGAFTVLYGRPGSCKTFLALDWAMSIGTGEHWQGLATSQGPVLYIANEGMAGLSLRVDAWKQTAKFNGDANVFFLPEAVQLLERKSIERLMKTLQGMPTQPKLFVVDTLARSLVGGDENSAKDIGELIAGIDHIRGSTGATALLVHHTGKTMSAQERGSSALRGAADTAISIHAKNNEIAVICEKQKEATEFERISLLRTNVKLDHGRNSCVLMDNEIDLMTGGLSEKQTTALKKLSEFEPDGTTAGEWLKASGLAEKTFYRILGKLRSLGLVDRPSLKSKGEKYTLTPEGRDAVTVA